MKDFLEVYLRKKASDIERKLRIAHLDLKVNTFLRRSMVIALFAGLIIAALVFLMAMRLSDVSALKNLIVSLIVLIVGSLFVFWFLIHTVDVQILKRKREMEKEVLFAGRYLLIKMQSGTPFFNSLIDASKVFGIAGRYFQEIIDEVNTGTPIEEVLDKASTNSPSKNFSVILREMNNALKLGVDVTKTLELILDDISEEQLEEIRGFGKKINALSMFYMIFAVVLPSLGLTILIIASSFIGLDIGLRHLFTVVFLLVFLQFMFLAMFKTLRPIVNL